DANGDLLLRSLTDAGVDTSWVARTDGPSGAAYIAVNREGENSIVVSPGANARVDIAMVDRAADAIRAAAVLFAVLEVPLSTVEHAVRLAADTGVRVVVNASPVADLSESTRSEEHTSELQSRENLVCRLLLEKKKRRHK